MVYSYAACNGFVSALVPGEKTPENVRNRGFVQFLYSVRLREKRVPYGLLRTGIGTTR